MTCHRIPELGGYVLHALAEREEYAVEQHLVDCDECLEEVGELAFTASLLALVRPEDALALDDSLDEPEPVEPVRFHERPESPRRVSRLRRRAMVAAAAAVLVAAGAAVPAVHLIGGSGQQPQAVLLHADGPAPRVHADVSVVDGDGGTGLHLSLSGAPRHGWCSLVAHAADGRHEIAATWPADGPGRVDVRGTPTIPAAQLSALSVVTDTGRRLVTIPVPSTSS